MKIKNVVLTAVCYTSVLLSGSAFSQELQNCNGNGLEQSAGKGQPGVRSHLFLSRNGDNGKGNGGESLNIYGIIVNGAFVSVGSECVRNADSEETGGIDIYIDFQNGEGYVLVNDNFVDIEFDPGNRQ